MRTAQTYDRYPPRMPLIAFQWPLLLLLILSGVLLWRFLPNWSPRSSGLNLNAEPRAIVPRGNLAEDEQSTIELFKQTSPSVVHITTMAVRQDRVTFDLLQIP